MKHNYSYLKEYLPVRYNASAEQKLDRQLCYNFKNGFVGEDIKKDFLKKVKTITANTKEGWVICFIPASTKQATLNRYKMLADFFKRNGYAVSTDAIFNLHDKVAEHIYGKTDNPIETFGFEKSCCERKKVILIDDIITRGATFNMVADKLEALGAISITGLFLAKTINPDYQPSSYTQNEECYDTDFYEEIKYEEIKAAYDSYRASLDSKTGKPKTAPLLVLKLK